MCVNKSANESIIHRVIIFNSCVCLISGLQVWHHGKDKHEPDPESKIWRLTGSGVFGAEYGFGVNFSDSAHLYCTPNYAP